MLAFFVNIFLYPNIYYRAEIIKEYKESGLSQRKWCAIHDEDRNRLQYWILRFQYLELGSEIMFAEINVGGDGNDTDTPE